MKSIDKRETCFKGKLYTLKDYRNIALTLLGHSAISNVSYYFSSLNDLKRSMTFIIRFTFVKSKSYIKM